MTIRKKEDYILDESPEISIGEKEGWAQGILKAFPAFSHSNYRIYFSGQVVSLAGFWLQQVALGWLVLELTGSAFWVGFVGALSNLPILLFGLFAGVVVDRYDTKKLLYFTQTLSAFFVCVLGLFTLTNHVDIGILSVLVFLLGTVNAIDLPTRQTFAVEMVGKKDLSSAIALNAGAFNAARIVGPAFSGYLISMVGTAGAFLLNAATYIPIIFALPFIKTNTTPPRTHPHPFHAAKFGLKYSFTHPIICYLMILSGITSIFGWSYTTILPVVVKTIFLQDVSQLGTFFAVSGIGALLGTFFVSLSFRKINPFFTILTGNCMFVISILFFTFTTNRWIALPFLFFSGLGLLLQYATTNSVIQHVVSDEVRGRVMGIYVLMFAGMTPFGNLQIGILSEHFGPLFAIRVGALVVLAFGLMLFFKRHVLLKEYQKQFH